LVPDVPIYIVFPTDGIGGAEKRLIGLWYHFQQKGFSNVQLVIPHGLSEAISKLEEFDLRPYADRIHVLSVEGGVHRSLIKILRQLHRSNKRSIFHYVLVPPAFVQTFWSRRTVFTCPMSGMSLYNLRGRLGTYAGCLLAGEVDFLNETVARDVARTLHVRPSRFSVTPGSHIDCDFYSPAPFEEKTNTLVFLGLFTHAKQAPRLFEAVPFVDRYLKERGITDAKFRFLGRDTEEGPLSERLGELPPDIDVRAYFEPNPRNTLRTAKVFFSLQRVSNYPSKSLLEAMACGTLPIVTDVGDTRLGAREPYAYFVERDFSAAAIAERCHEILTLDRAAFESRVNEARAFLRERFSIDATASYFAELYRRADAR
jgi:glycosyltransferase involved in cell wall biosynthesis